MMPIEEVHRKVEEWVVDPVSMAGRAIAYAIMIMIYWFIKNLMAHASLSSVAKKEVYEEPARAWKEYNAYCSLMHKNIDIMAYRMRIQFYHPGMLQMEVGGSSRKENHEGDEDLKMTEGAKLSKRNHKPDAKRTSLGVPAHKWV